jgi:membrane protein required for colicin V production
MNWVDFVIIGLISISALVGLARGLIREVLSVAVWASALLLAWIYFPKLEGHLAPWMDAGTIRMAAAFLILVLVVLVVGTLIGHLLTLLVEKTGLTGTDRLLGGLFGAVRGALLIAMSVFLAALTPLPDDDWWKGSAFIDRFQVLAQSVLSEVPPRLVERVKRL